MAKSAAAALHTEPKEPNFLQKFGHDFVHGDIFTKLSFFVWGLGYIGHGQLMKALLVTFVQGFALYFLAFFGVPNLAKFGTLGTVKMEMVFDVATMKNVVNDYDNSFEILLMSMIAFIVIAALIAAAMMVVSSNYQLQKIREAGKKTNNFVQETDFLLLLILDKTNQSSQILQRQAAAKGLIHHGGTLGLLDIFLFNKARHLAVGVLQNAPFAELFQHGIGRTLFPAQRVGGQRHQLPAGQRLMVPHKAGKTVFTLGKAQRFMVWHRESSFLVYCNRPVLAYSLLQ